MSTLLTSAALPANSFHAGGGPSDRDTLTGTSNGQLFVDGVGVSNGDTVYAKDESALSHNGVYTVTTAGDGSNPYVLNRNYGSPSITDTVGPLTSGVANAFSQWIFTLTGGVVHGVTNGSPTNLSRLYPDVKIGGATGFLLNNNLSSPNSNLDIAAGSASDSTNVVHISSAGMTKNLSSSWSAGNSNGGLFSGSVAANTVYHVFAIRKDSDASVDFGFDVSPVAANIPGGYTYFVRVGSILTDGSNHILPFKGRINF